MDAESYHKMVETKVESSYCPSTSSLSSAADVGGFPGENQECGADRMVKIELEAAEALAGLAHSAMHESETAGSESGGNEGKRSSRRIRTESPPGDSGMNPEHSVLGSSDLAEDKPIMVQQQCETKCNVMTKTVKAEQDAELPKPSPICTTSYASAGGGKSRQNLTDAEKEARRLRRVLANRESARQTIRRRQALYEELTRKGAELAWENENLKRKKELAMKEYDSLKSTNERLKAQMAEVMKAEVGETQHESKSTHVERSTIPSSNCPYLIYNQTPFAPFLWPSMIQSSSPFQLQCGLHNATAVPSKEPMPTISKPDSFHEQENPLRINGPGTPLYILPCSWFFPLPVHGNRLHPQPSLDLNDKLNQTSVNNQCSTSSFSKTTAHVENNHSSLPRKVKTEPSSSTEAIPANNLHVTPFGCPPDGGGQHVEPHPKGMILMPTPLTCVSPPVTVKHENGTQPDYTPNVKASPSTISHTANVSAENNQEPDSCPSKKLVDSVAAAEARKRRKVLTKLKNLHCRQFRMHC